MFKLIRLIFILIIFFANMGICEEPHHITAYIGYSGELESLLTCSRYSTKSFWNKEGKKLPTFNRFNRTSYLLYSEYAVTNYHSLSFNGGYSIVKESLNGDSKGVNDLEIGWKYLFRETKFSALTAQLIGIIPTGEKRSSIRYGKFGFQPTLLYSRIFYLANHCGWYDLGLGYRFYQGFPSDQIRGYGALGYNISRYIQVIATSQINYGVFNGKSECNLNNVVFHSNYRLFKAQIECVIKACSHFSISLGGYWHIWGQNIGNGGGGFGGVWMVF